MKPVAILLDLGGTLVHYYQRAEVPAVYDEAVAQVAAALRRQGRLRLSPDEVRERAAAEAHEAPDFCVRPLEDRLARIFFEGRPLPAERAHELCSAFLRPVMARARRYDDTLPALDRLLTAGRRLAIVSNAPWGSPAVFWRQEMARQELAERVELAVICRDAGWRKPALPIFALALERLGLPAHACLFVGDHPHWDVTGAQAAGLQAVLIDRDGAHPSIAAPRVRDLAELVRMIS